MPYKDPAAKQAYTAAWYARNKAKIAAYNRRYKMKTKAQNKAKNRAYNRRYTTGVVPTRPEPLHCEICGGPPVSKKVLCLDHCHSSGQFRGWLCHKCNSAIGLFNDNPALLRAAADYVAAGGPPA